MVTVIREITQLSKTWANVGDGSMSTGLKQLAQIVMGLKSENFGVSLRGH